MIRDRRTQYARGADLERKARDELMHDHGAAYVVRSAGSRGIVDLVAFFPGGEMRTDDYTAVYPIVWMVQVKRDGKINDEDRELLMSLAAEAGALPVLAYPVNLPNRKIGVEFKELVDA